MHNTLLERFLNSSSDNLKSKIQNLKLVGIAIVVALTLCAARAEAQQAGKILRIGFLDAGTASGSAVMVNEFRQELSKLGWIEGKNITMEYRFAEQQFERLLELAAELVRLNVDVILATAGPIVLAAKAATTAIPIVMTNAGDPVGEGMVTSLARALGFSSRAEYQKAGDTQRRSAQAWPSWTSAIAGKYRRTRPTTERAQTCGSGTEVNIGGDRDSSRCQRFRERLSSRKTKGGRGDYDDYNPPFFR